jgi:hypothetical protein
MAKAATRCAEGSSAGVVRGEIVQRQEQEDDRHHLDRDLGKRKVRGGHVGKAYRDSQPDDAKDHEGKEPLAVQRGHGHGRGTKHGPAQNHDRVHRRHLSRQGAGRARGPGQRRCPDHRHHANAGHAGKAAIVQTLTQAVADPHQAADARIEHALCVGLRQAVPELDQRPRQPENHQPAANGQKRQPHRRRLQAVPVLCVKLDRGGGDGLGGEVDQPAGQGHRHQADRHHQGRQHGRRKPKTGAGVMRMVGVVDAFGAQEGARQEAEGIGDRETAPPRPPAPARASRCQANACAPLPPASFPWTRNR